MTGADEIRDVQRATWAGLSAGWEKWETAREPPAGTGRTAPKCSPCTMQAAIDAGRIQANRIAYVAGDGKENDSPATS